MGVGVDTILVPIESEPTDSGDDHQIGCIGSREHLVCFGVILQCRDSVTHIEMEAISHEDIADAGAGKHRAIFIPYEHQDVLAFRRLNGW
jgi:hypothetical protein